MIGGLASGWVATLVIAHLGTHRREVSHTNLNAVYLVQRVIETIADLQCSGNHALGCPNTWIRFDTDRHQAVLSVNRRNKSPESL
jgi:hypothetical protein